MRKFIRKHLQILYTLLICTLYVVTCVCAYTGSYEQAVFGFIYASTLFLFSYDKEYQEYENKN